MPAERLSMRKVYEVLRLKFGCGRTNREIAQSCSIGRSTVSDYLLRAKAAGFSWPLPPELDEASLERLLFPSTDNPTSGKLQPDWSEIHQELKGKNVTLALLWQEYKERNPEGLQYSWFCQQYARWRGKLDVVMRQNHRAGERMFVDYAGQTVSVIDRTTGEVREAQVFVAVLGASSYTYAEATWSQKLPDWIGSHVRAFSWFGGVTELLVPDNLKSGVDKPCLYEPDINPSYQDLAAHYGTAVLPARVRKPKDKAKAESGVQVVERWILARLRHHQFFSLEDLNREIRRLVEELNSRPFQKLPGSRKSMYESIDRPALLPLPVTPYQFAEWRKATVHIDYHVEVDGHYYSVPHPLKGKRLEIRFTQSTVECLFRGQRVASHPRSYQKGSHSTLAEHMPPNHRKYAEWSPERFLRWAKKIGPSTLELAERIFASRKHPQQAYRSLLGILRLGKSYTDERLEAACRRALAINALSYRSIESILKNNMENKPLPARTAASPVAAGHRNIRGAGYYVIQEGKPC